MAAEKSNNFGLELSEIIKHSEDVPIDALKDIFNFTIKEEIERRKKLMKFVNLTKHPVNLNNGRMFIPSGIICRTVNEFSEIDESGICRIVNKKITGLPPKEKNTIYIVSSIVLSTAMDLFKDRNDVVAPMTTHQNVKRNNNGDIISVPGFYRS